MAFEDVCPDRIDLIHKNYRKLCNLLIDIDEWGQVAVIHMLTRYARTQFINPNKEVRISSYTTQLSNCYIQFCTNFQMLCYRKQLRINIDSNIFVLISLYQRVIFIQNLSPLIMMKTVMMRHLKRNQRNSLMLWILTIGYFCGRANHFFKAGMLQ